MQQWTWTVSQLILPGRDELYPEDGMEMMDGMAMMDGMEMMDGIEIQEGRITVHICPFHLLDRAPNQCQVNLQTAGCLASVSLAQISCMDDTPLSLFCAPSPSP